MVKEMQAKRICYIPQEMAMVAASYMPPELLYYLLLFGYTNKTPQTSQYKPQAIVFRKAQ
jgi:hypothetical protein